MEPFEGSALVLQLSHVTAMPHINTVLVVVLLLQIVSGSEEAKKLVDRLNALKNNFRFYYQTPEGLEIFEKEVDDIFDASKGLPIEDLEIISKWLTDNKKWIRGCAGP